MAKLNVGKWQAARRGPRYVPVMQFFLRQIHMAMFEAMRVKGVTCYYRMLLDPINEYEAMVACDKGRDIELWDTAIMARDWIARAAPLPAIDRVGWLLSFDAACEALGCNPDVERVAMLEKIDAAADFDTEECWARLEYLTANPPDEMEDPLFDAPRCVPVLDQGNLFAMMGAM